MGCDIHCYIEYQQPNSDWWRDFGGRINPGRSYFAFGKLAGVRNYDENNFIPPRGLPKDLAYESQHDARLFVYGDGEDDGCTSREKADRWVANGTSRYLDDDKKFVSHPDWHSHSWLTADEYEQAIKDVEGHEYHAILAAMRSFESRGLKSRLVFWFDS